MEHHNNIAKHIVKKHTILFKNIIIGLFLFLPFLVNGQVPTVTTNGTSNITPTTAIGWGFINDIGSPDPTAHGFCWSTSANPTISGSHTDEGGVTEITGIMTTLSGLTPGTIYYARAYATNSTGTGYGNETSFTTPKVPTITTQAVSPIFQTTATGNGNITDLGVPNPTAHGVCWSELADPTTADSHTDEGTASSDGAFTTNMTSLTPGETYHVRAYATNDGGTSYGTEVSFTTFEDPTVTTQAVSAITQTTATGNGSVTDLGVPNPTAYGVCWNTTGTPTTGDGSTDLGAASTTGAFTAGMTSLTPGQTYYVRAFATNTQATVYGNEVSFTALIEPTVTTQAVTNITDITATGNGNITVLGIPNPTAYGVCWRELADPTTANNHTDEGTRSSTGAFTSAITGLTENTTYHVRAYATNSEGTVYGSDVSFTTYALPTVTTEAVSLFDQTTATGNGTISDLGVPNPTAHGVCWSTSTSPTTSGSHTDEGGAGSIGSFTSSITGLTEGTLYYVRAYATNLGGTVYGNEVSFTTFEDPAVSTQAVSTITQTTATGNGTITDLGVPNPTQHGVCWNIAGTPTTGDNLTTQGAASATGAFTSSITVLTPGTTYYVRTYATNTQATVYGDEVSFTALIPPTVTTQAVTDLTNISATGNGNITVLGVPNPTAYGVCWSESADPEITDSHTDEGNASATGAFTSDITGLTENIEYHVRAYATNSEGTAYGSDVTFTTYALPTVTTQAVTDITDISATGNGNITDLGVPNPTTYGVCWSESIDPTTADSHTDQGAIGTTGAFTSSITSLTTNTLYHVRAYTTSSTNMISNGTFDSGTGWTIPGNWSISGSIASYDALAGNEIKQIDGNMLSSIEPNTDYTITFDISNGTGFFTIYSESFNVYVGLDTYVTGSYELHFTTPSDIGSGGFKIFAYNYATGTYFDIDNIVLTEDSNTMTVYGDDVTFTTLGLPTVTTQAVSDITQTTAIGNGTITDLGVPNPTAYGICWNTTGTPETTDFITDLGAASATSAFTAGLTSLTPGQIYYVRAFATNTQGTVYGTEVSFTALIEPTVTTQAVTNITDIAATGNGNITVLGVPNPTAHGVCWSESADPEITDSHTDEGGASTTGAFTSTITGLTKNTTYHVRAYATNSTGTVYGSDVTFTTLNAPMVTTEAVSAIAQTTATGNGTITDLGVPNPTAHGVCWSTSTNPTISGTSSDEGGADATGSFTSAITGLSEGTLYYVRAYATNTEATAYGNEVSFTTLEEPTVTTQDVSAIAQTTATGNGTITDLGVPNPTAYGICWSESADPETTDFATDKGAASATGTFTSDMTSLTPGTTYFVRAYATNSQATVYGNEVSFTALIEPTVTTQAVTGITDITATGNGNITVLGVPNPTAHGVCWSESADPTTADSHTDELGASGTGAFTSDITVLTKNTSYHVRAYATNSEGTVYGSDVSFTTLNAPMVTTEAVSAIAQTTATGNGTITDLGVPNPTAHGVCWSTSTSPTTSGSHTDELGADATGSFTSSITGLTPGTTYYVKAYATNTQAIAYGNEVIFTTLEEPTVTTQAVTDITDITATGNGNITVLGIPNPTAHGVCWSESADPEITDSHTDEGGASGIGAFTSSITELTKNTTYHVRAYATNSAGTVYGSDVNFTTLNAPMVTTEAVSAIAQTTATGNGTITDLGVPNPTAHGVCWSTSTSPTTSGSHTDELGADATGSFTSDISGLTEGTLYYVRAYATNTQATAYGNEVSFTTLEEPTVTTEAVTIIAQNSATGNGTITDLGVPNPTQHGVCWNTTGTPETTDNLTTEGISSTTDPFTSSITGLAPGTTYYVRAYATNTEATIYGDQVSFTTLNVDATWIGSSGTDWATASNWNPSGVPASDANILIPDVSNNPVIGSSTDVSCNDLFIVGSSTILTINSDASNTGSLIVSGTSTGNVTQERYMAGSQFHIISSPVSGYNINTYISDNNIDESPNSSPTIYAFRDHNGGVGWNAFASYSSPPSTELIAGKGYQVAVVSPNETTSFTGFPRNSQVLINVVASGNGWNVIGNPFTSAIAITSGTGATDYFLSSTNLDVLPDATAAIWVYDPDIGTKGGFTAYSSTEGEDYIPIGQGFYVLADVGGNIQFETTMQIHNTGAVFEKKSAKKSAEYPLIHLKANNETNSIDSKIYFIENMTEGLDPTWDIGFFEFDEDFHLYSKLIEDINKDFFVQCLPNTNFSSMSVPIGLDFTEGGLVAFSAETLNLPSECLAILEDRELEIYTDLKAVDASYSVALPANTTGTGRFFLHTFNPQTVNVDVDDLQNITIFAFEKEIIVQGEIAERGLLRVYDLSGRMVKSAMIESGNRHLIPASELKDGIYIIHLNVEGKTKVSKLFLH